MQESTPRFHELSRLTAGPEIAIIIFMCLLLQKKTFISVFFVALLLTGLATEALAKQSQTATKSNRITVGISLTIPARVDIKNASNNDICLLATGSKEFILRSSDFESRLSLSAKGQCQSFSELVKDYDRHRKQSNGITSYIVEPI